MIRRFSFYRRLLPYILLFAAFGVVLPALVGTPASAQSTVQTASPSQASQGECTRRICTFELQVNPGLQPGHPFACPAIQNAQARITITNRFVTGAQNDIMVLTAKGLPKNTGFDMFLVQHSPLDQGTFPGFGPFIRSTKRLGEEHGTWTDQRFARKSHPQRTRFGRDTGVHRR